MLTDEVKRPEVAVQLQKEGRLWRATIMRLTRPRRDRVLLLDSCGHCSLLQLSLCPRRTVYTADTVELCTVQPQMWSQGAH